MGLANRISEGELETTGEGAGADGAEETGGLSNTFFNPYVLLGTFSSTKGCC